MNAPARLAAFGLGLVAVFAAALGVGRLAGPEPAESAAEHGAGHAAASAGTGQPAETPEGLQVSERGYTLQLSAPTAPAGPATVEFRVLGRDGRPLRAYETTHEKELHLILVQRDLSNYRHLHPARDPAGMWRTRVDFASGFYRVFADFQPVGEAEPLTLGADLIVSGSLHPGLLPAPSSEEFVDDYAVTVDGTLAPGSISRLSFTVRKGGRPVVDLQPYLGAAGHLVALRAGDLAYLHVHPVGGGLNFDVDVPSPGTYRLYLEFRHADAVRTVEFTAVAGTGAARSVPVAPSPSGGGHGDHDSGD